MITGQQCIALIIGSLFIGIIIGMLIYYWKGTPKCKHEWEKIIDDKFEYCGSLNHSVVHMCTKCGKRIFTKI